MQHASQYYRKYATIVIKQRHGIATYVALFAFSVIVMSLGGTVRRVGAVRVDERLAENIRYENTSGGDYRAHLRDSVFVGAERDEQS